MNSKRLQTLLKTLPKSQLKRSTLTSKSSAKIIGDWNFPKDRLKSSSNSVSQSLSPQLQVNVVTYDEFAQNYTLSPNANAGQENVGECRIVCSNCLNDEYFTTILRDIHYNSHHVSDFGIQEALEDNDMRTLIAGRETIGLDEFIDLANENGFDQSITLDSYGDCVDVEYYNNNDMITINCTNCGSEYYYRGHWECD